MIIDLEFQEIEKLKSYLKKKNKALKNYPHRKDKNAATTTTAGCSAKGLFSSVYLRRKMNFSSSSTSLSLSLSL